MYNDEIMGALADLIKNETSEETKKYKDLILKRIAEETEVKPTRIPAPLNITELGGYYNLIDQIQENLPEPSEHDPSEAYRNYVKAQKLWLEEQKYQLKLSIIQSALGLPK
ncbi:MAG: hypothetical protein IJ905_03550 [Fibrobacter sp.]|nr:hypothetical protein [Fibrobacter sp.]